MASLVHLHLLNRGPKRSDHLDTQDLKSHTHTPLRGQSSRRLPRALTRLVPGSSESKVKSSQTWQKACMSSNCSAVEWRCTWCDTLWLTRGLTFLLLLITADPSRQTCARKLLRQFLNTGKLSSSEKIILTKFLYAAQMRRSEAFSETAFCSHTEVMKDETAITF